MVQEFKQHHNGRKVEDVTSTPQADAEGQERRAKMSDDIDSLLDEIDSVLEPNAQGFVAAFVQGGGE